MPKTGELLLERLRRRYPQPKEAALALGVRPNTVSVWMSRGTVPPKDWDMVRRVLEGPAHSLRVVRPSDRPVTDPNIVRHLKEFVALVVNTPGFKDILLGHDWHPEDRKLVAEIIASIEGDEGG